MFEASGGDFFLAAPRPHRSQLLLFIDFQFRLTVRFISRVTRYEAVRKGDKEQQHLTLTGGGEVLG